MLLRRKKNVRAQAGHGRSGPAMKGCLGSRCAPLVQPLEQRVLLSISAPTVTVAQNAQLVSLSWSTIQNATGYQIQRSTDGGSTWSNLESSAITGTSDVDYDYRNGSSWRLQPSTSYSYRLVEFESGATNYSSAVGIATSNFRVFDGTTIANKPSLMPYGLNGANVVSQQFLENGDGSINQTEFNQAAANSVARNQVFVIDIENWGLDLANSSKGTVETNLQNLITAITTAKASYPTVQIGFFGIAGLNGYGQNEPDYVAWRKSCDLWTGHDDDTSTYYSQYDLVSHFDFLAPVSYPFGDPSVWNAAIMNNELAEARYMTQEDGNSSKPVYEFVSPNQFNTADKYGNGTDNTFVPPDYFQLNLATIRSNAQANGVIIWAAQQTQYGAEGWYGPNEQAWWNVTTNFVNEPAAAAPSAATSLGSSDGVHLSWTNNAGSVDGWVIERSTASGSWKGVPTTGFPPIDGTVVQTPGPTANHTDGSFITFGDVTRWEDPSAKANQTYYYRVAPFKAVNTLSWSNSSPDMGLNWSNTFTVNPASNPANTDVYATAAARRYTSGWQTVPPNPTVAWNNSDYWAGVSFYSNATYTFEFDKANFGGVAPGRFRASMGAADTMHVAVYLDSRSGGDGTDGKLLGGADVPANSSADIALSYAQGFDWNVAHNLFVVFSPVGSPPQDWDGFNSFYFVPNTADFEQPVNPGPVPTTPQSFYLRKDADGTHLDFWQNVTPDAAFDNFTSQKVLANLWYFSIQGSTVGGDTITLDNTLGNAIPTCAIHFLGSGTPSTLNVIGTRGTTASPAYDVFREYANQDGSNWDHFVSFNGSLVYLGSSTGVVPNLQINYTPGINTASYNTYTTLGVYNNLALNLKFQPNVSGIQRMNFSDIVLGNGSVLTAPSTVSHNFDPTNTSDKSAHQNRAVYVVTAMSLGSSPTGDVLNALGTFDLADSDMVLTNLEVIDGQDNSGLSQQELLRRVIQHAYNAGAWNGAGIRSAAAANDPHLITAVGYALNDGSTIPAYSTFDGVSVGSSSLLLKYTFYGDTNLDGGTDFSDLLRQGQNSGSNKYWKQGDCNYDGTVDSSDQPLLQSAYGDSGL